MLGKPTASLSSGLLARKGHARPAMRPQGFNPLMPGTHEDLGWNDMGHDTPEPAPYPQPVAYEPPADMPAPPVLRQRAELEEQIAPKAEPAPVPVEYEPEPESAPEPVQAKAPAPKPVAVPKPVSAGTLARVARETQSKKAKAAFTLRLDHDRHLRLRLASAVSNLSAQQLVTEALDAFLDSLPDVDALARQLAGGEGSGE